MLQALAWRSFYLLLVSTILLCALPARAATDCSKLPGTREATADDAVVKNGQIPAGTCWNPNDPGIGQQDEEAKLYLRSLPRTGTASQDQNIAKLNNAFAKCAAKFLKDFTARYGNVTISSAYRDPAYEAAMCRNNPACGALMNNPNPQGNHQRGLAMDVWQGTPGSSDNAKIRDFAQQNPQYGVCFPFAVPGTGFYDRPHMILAGGPGSEGNGAGCRGVTRACDGANFNPNDIRYSPGTYVNNNPYPNGVSAPTGGTNNPFSNPYNPTQQGQMCMVSTDPIVMVPCGQTAQQIPQPQNLASGYPQTQTTGSGSVSTGGSATNAQRFDTSFALPTPNTTSTFVPPPRYTYATPTSQVVPTSPTQSPPPTKPATINTTTRQNPSTVLNADLQNGTGIGDTVGYVDSGNVAINTATQNPVAEQPRTTQTFTETPRPIQPTVVATTSSIVIQALTTLRNLLVSYLNLLKSRDAAGFHGSWQLPGTTFSY